MDGPAAMLAVFAKLFGLGRLIPSSWRLYIAAIALLAALIIGWSVHERHVGRDGEKAAEAKRLERAKADVAKRETKASAISTAVASNLTAERVKIEYRTKTLIQKVPTYVTPAADARCIVNVGFVRAYDDQLGSASGVSPAPGGSVETPSGVPLSRVLETDLYNLGLAQSDRAEVLAWRSWYTKQAAEWAKPKP